MGIPQIIFIVINLLGLGIALGEHNTPKTGHNNFWKSLLACGIEFALLWWGGFFG